MGRPLIAIGVPFRRGGFTQITNDYITRVYAEGGTLTDNEKTALNLLTQNTDIAEFDRLWVHGLQNEVAARTSVVNALTADLITNVNSTTFTAGQGFQGNGTTMYLDTNYNPSVDGVNFTQNSSSYGGYFSVLSKDGGCGIGNFNVAQNFLYLANEPTLRVSVNDVGASSSDISIQSGLLVNGRSVAGQKYGVVNGTLSSNIASASSTVPSDDFFILALSNIGTATAFNASKISFSFIGSGAIDQAQFYTDVQTLGTTLGWAV